MKTPNSRSTLKEKLESERSKQARIALTNYILDNEEEFPLLLAFAFGEDAKNRMFSSWVMDHVLEKNPQLLFDNQTFFFEKGMACTDTSVNRAWTRALSRIEIPEKYEGEIVELMFNWLTDHSTPIAVKAHAMQTLYQLTHRFPELKSELIIVLEDLLPYGSAGIKSRSSKLIALLRKEINKKGKI